MTKYKIAAAIEKIKPLTYATICYESFTKKELVEWLEEVKRSKNSEK